MKIGYPCLNYSIGCKANATFRLKNFSNQRFLDTVDNNLRCLSKILHYNLEHNLLFFRISSEVIPFASHPICKIDWQQYYKSELHKIGNFIKNNNIRISMHPDQFVVINSIRPDVVDKSIRELEWHSQFLDCMGLNQTAKIQIHVGGAYGDKTKSIDRFIDTYQYLPNIIKKRLVIENDDRLFGLVDCWKIYQSVNIPIIFDVLHHACLNNNETLITGLLTASKTWHEKDGVPMVDYSSQQIGGRKGKHADTLDANDFEHFISQSKKLDFDIMLEIKDKEKSAAKAIAIANKQRKMLSNG